MAQLGGGDFASGATVVGVNEAIQNELSKIKDPALHQWASAIVGAAVAEGTIEVKDQENQKQDVEELSRDTKNANDKLDKIFDVVKLTNKVGSLKGLASLGIDLTHDWVSFDGKTFIKASAKFGAIAAGGAAAYGIPIVIVIGAGGVVSFFVD